MRLPWRRKQPSVETPEQTLARLNAAVANPVIARVELAKPRPSPAASPSAVDVAWNREAARLAHDLRAVIWKGMNATTVIDALTRPARD